MNIMIVDNELKLYNWVKNENGVPSTIVALDRNSVRFGGMSVFTNINDIDPILLTEEILIEKCDFNKWDSNGNVYFSKDNTELLVVNGLFMSLDEKYEISYVHDLQNKYYLENSKKELSVNYYE